jgi:DNA-binding FadR family transcriptional regulator
VIDAEVDATTDSRSTRFLRSFHLELADLSGNTAIGLFTEILMELQSEFVTEGSRPHRGEEALTADANASHRAHVAIYNAILSGDVERAKSHMGRHLDAINRWTVAHVASTEP